MVRGVARKLHDVGGLTSSSHDRAVVPSQPFRNWAYQNIFHYLVDTHVPTWVEDSALVGLDYYGQKENTRGVASDACESTLGLMNVFYFELLDCKNCTFMKK